MLYCQYSEASITSRSVKNTSGLNGCGSLVLQNFSDGFPLPRHFFLILSPHWILTLPFIYCLNNIKNTVFCWLWWCTSVILALWRLCQEYHELKGSFIYIVRPCHKQANKFKKALHQFVAWDFQMYLIFSAELSAAQECTMPILCLSLELMALWVLLSNWPTLFPRTLITNKMMPDPKNSCINDLLNVSYLNMIP